MTTQFGQFKEPTEAFRLLAFSFLLLLLLMSAVCIHQDMTIKKQRDIIRQLEPSLKPSFKPGRTRA